MMDEDYLIIVAHVDIVERCIRNGILLRKQIISPKYNQSLFPFSTCP